MFYNYLKAAVVVRDFSKGLKAIIAAKAAVNFNLIEITKEPLVCLKDKDEELFKVVEVVVYKGLNYKQLQHILLQLYK